MSYDESAKSLVGYASGQQGLLAVGRAYKPSQQEMLLEKKKALEAELERVDKALRALEEHPEIERVMTLVSQALY